MLHRYNNYVYTVCNTCTIHLSYFNSRMAGLLFLEEILYNVYVKWAWYNKTLDGPDQKLSAACSVQITSCRLHALSRSQAVNCMLCPDHELSDVCSVQITSCRLHALSRSQAVSCMLCPDHKLSDACSVRSVGYMLCPDHELLDTCSVQITSCRLHALSRSWAVGCMLCQITSCQMHALSWSQAVGCMLWPDHKLSDVCSDQITSCRMHALSDL